jgi:hypothetical protein
VKVYKYVKPKIGMLYNLKESLVSSGYEVINLYLADKNKLRRNLTAPLILIALPGFIPILMTHYLSKDSRERDSYDPKYNNGKKLPSISKLEAKIISTRVLS